jgi:hypothetical protein
MKINESLEFNGITDVICDVCSRSTILDTGVQQCGSLQAQWGPGSSHVGERYEVHLCELCFFQALANLKQERRTHNLFSENLEDLPGDLGLVAKDLHGS